MTFWRFIGGWKMVLKKVYWQCEYCKKLYWAEKPAMECEKNCKFKKEVEEMPEVQR